MPLRLAHPNRLNFCWKKARVRFVFLFFFAFPPFMAFSSPSKQCVGDKWGVFPCDLVPKDSSALSVFSSLAPQSQPFYDYFLERDFEKVSFPSIPFPPPPPFFLKFCFSFKKFKTKTKSRKFACGRLVLVHSLS